VDGHQERKLLILHKGTVRSPDFGQYSSFRFK
jgi:hypothetical protein